MAIKKNDFIEISFTGRVKSNNLIFDITDEETAKKEGVYNPKLKYGTKKICVGQGHILPGIDRQLEGKETGKHYNLEVKYNEAFGNKDSNLIKTMNSNIFIKERINPFPGLQITADGYLGIIKSVSGGRVVVDFNHPLAGKDLVYDMNILREIKNSNEQLKVLLLNELALNEENYEINGVGQNYRIILKKNIPEQIKEKFISRVKELIPKINIKF